MNRLLVMEDRADGQPRGRVPEPHRIVVAGRDELSVRAESHTPDPAPGGKGREQEFSVRDTPEPRSSVLAAGEHGVAVGTERQCFD